MIGVTSFGCSETSRTSRSSVPDVQSDESIAMQCLDTDITRTGKTVSQNSNEMSQVLREFRFIRHISKNAGISYSYL